ncbi:hypothetical protein ACIBCN_23375 [Nocardia sp. NPDC051052]|uniref:hypothetical protein n=1 Tax=Nocardia sp. NPDC051052 TaxID=3364322 RepID=UPI0037AFE569
MPHRRPCLVALCGAVLIAVTTTGCLGAVDRADFEKVIQARGGGLVSALPSAAIDSLRQRLGTTEIHVSVIALTAPASNSFRLSMLDQQPPVTRFVDENHNLAGQDPAAHLRIQVPTRPDQQDDYTFANGTLHGPTPVHVSAADHPDDEMFDVGDVSGLLRLEEVLDTAVTRAAVDGGYVTSVVVNRIGADVVMTVNVTSPRTTVVAQFDRAGTFLRMSQV